MPASQIIGKNTAKWLVAHGLLINSEQVFASIRSLLVYIKAVYLNRNIEVMTEFEIEELTDSDLEGFCEIVARRLLRGE